MSTIVTCRNCARQLRVAGNGSASDVCPRCYAPLDIPGADPVESAPTLLRDVRRDSNATTWILAFLMGLCAVGIILTCSGAANTAGHSRSSNSALVLITVVGVLDLGLCCSMALLSWRIFPKVDHQGVNRAVRVAGLIAMAAGLVLALYIFVYVACISAIGVMMGGP